MIEYSLTPEQFKKTIKSYARHYCLITAICFSIILIFLIALVLSQIGNEDKSTLYEAIVAIGFFVLVLISFLSLFLNWSRKAFKVFASRCKNGKVDYKLDISQKDIIKIKAEDREPVDFVIDKRTKVYYCKETSCFFIFKSKMSVVIPDSEEIRKIAEPIKAKQ